jgi:hypothetical protein
MLPAHADDVARVQGATRYGIDLTIDLAALTLRGSEWVRYTNRTGKPLAEIVYRLLANWPGYGGSMTVHSLAVDGEALEPEFGLSDSALYVPLVPPLAPGATVDVELAFTGTIPVAPLAARAKYGFENGILALPHAYPLIPVYDDEGWNVELAQLYGDPTFTDISLYQVRVTLPEDMVLVASGVAVDRRDNADGTATHTYASGPMRDFALAASADYRSQSAQVGRVTVTSTYLPEHEAGGRQALEYTAQALHVYQELLDPYPFAEMDVVETTTVAGGLEYPGLIAIAGWVYEQPDAFIELVTAHEVAHQWWYNLVGNDQPDEPWLDEALAEYTTILYLEQRYGRERAQEVIELYFEGPHRQLQDENRDMPIGLPVRAYTKELYGPVIYGKGPLFFHAMRQQVGDETFVEILRSYLGEHRYGVAYPEDLLRVAEQVSGQNLDPLYREWIVGD